MIFSGPQKRRDTFREGRGCTGRVSFTVTRTYRARLVTLLGSGVTRQVRTAAPEQLGGTLLSCMEEGVEMLLSLTP